MTDISNSADILDVRDVIVHFEELKDERENACTGEDDDGKEYAVLAVLLRDLKGEGGDHKWRGDWYPVTLVRDSYWMEYAQEEAEELYGKQLNESVWPFTCIDWDKAADALQEDYTLVEFDGVTYWFR